MPSVEAVRCVIPGIALAVAIAVGVHMALRPVQVVPDVVAALLVGIALGNAATKSWSEAGARLVVRYGLRVAIIALGAGLDLSIVPSLGAKALLLIFALVMIAMTLGLVVGRIGGLDRTVSTLIGVGTAICGASAILAVSPLLRARPNQTAYAIATIFAFNIVALIVLPPIGHRLELTQLTFGTWIGTAVNDTSVVVATGYLYGPSAGAIATLVKLTRTLLLVPLSVVVGLSFGAGASNGSVLLRAWRAMPWFVLGFLALAAANTTRLIPTYVAQATAQGGALLLVVVLAAVGLGVDVGGIWRMGAKPLLIGFGLATAMATLSLFFTALLGIGISSAHAGH